MQEITPEQRSTWFELFHRELSELSPIAGPLAPLSHVVYAWLVLQLLGNPEDLESEAELCQHLYERTRARTFFVVDELDYTLSHGLAARGAELLILADRARTALGVLSEKGWDYDFKRAMPTRTSGGRPRDLYRDIVELVLLDTAPRVLDGGAIPSEPVRERIASHLRPWLRLELMEVSSSGLLYRTISNIRDAVKRD